MFIKGLDPSCAIVQIASYEEMKPQRQKDHIKIRKFTKSGHVSLRSNQAVTCQRWPKFHTKLMSLILRWLQASDSGLNSLTALKEAVLIAIRTPPPPRSDRSLLKPECNISELLIFWFNHVSLTHTTSEFSAYTRSWRRWRLHTDCQFLLLSL